MPVDDLGEFTERLDDAFGRWMAEGARDYEFQFKWLCFCAPQMTTRARITVESDSITGATYEPETGAEAPAGTPKTESYRTVTGLFDLLREAVGRKAHSIQATFDPEDGHPITAFIDYVDRVADEEMGFEVQSIRFPGRDYAALQEELDLMRARWTAAAAADYTFIMRWGCFCPPEITAPVRVTVRSGKVDSVDYVERGRFDQPPGIDRFVTIDGVFDFVQRQIDNEADSIKVSYDRALGYPAEVTVDLIAMAIDDEQALAITEVTLNR
jgi:hypothetical protein